MPKPQIICKPKPCVIFRTAENLVPALKIYAPPGELSGAQSGIGVDGVVFLQKLNYRVLTGSGGLPLVPVRASQHCRHYIGHRRYFG